MFKRSTSPVCAVMLLVSVISYAGAALAAGPTGFLNDTGMSQAYDSGGLLPCTTANTGDGSAYPRQDCRYGRDAEASAGTLAKTGGGSAGFDFTPLDAAGNTISLTVDKKPTSTPTCVRDNVTNLIWEVKTTDSGLHDGRWTYTWYDSNFTTNGGLVGTSSGGSCGGTVTSGCDMEKFAIAANVAGFCGTGSLWRIPTRRELLSIINSGMPASAVSIDPDYFVNESAKSYWASESSRSDPGYAWVVETGQGSSSTALKNGYWGPCPFGGCPMVPATAIAVRLVRSGP